MSGEEQRGGQQVEAHYSHISTCHTWADGREYGYFRASARPLLDRSPHPIRASVATVLTAPSSVACARSPPDERSRARCTLAPLPGVTGRPRAGSGGHGSLHKPSHASPCIALAGGYLLSGVVCATTPTTVGAPAEATTSSCSCVTQASIAATCSLVGCTDCLHDSTTWRYFAALARHSRVCAHAGCARRNSAISARSASMTKSDPATTLRIARHRRSDDT